MVSYPPESNLSLIIPIHRNVSSVVELVEKVISYEKIQIRKIIICHNGPYLDEVSSGQKALAKYPIVEFLHTDKPGLGEGCKMGINACDAEYFLITGADLPFGFSDLNQWVELLAKGEIPEVVIGSKLHPLTETSGRSLLRKVSTMVFSTVKNLLLVRGLPLDTQGTIFMETQLGKEMSSLCEASGFFFTTELVTRAVFRGARFKEIPVTYRAKENESSVSPLWDGIDFLKNLWRLRRTLRKGKL